MRTKPKSRVVFVAVGLSIGIANVACAQGGKPNSTADLELAPGSQKSLDEFHRTYVLDDGEVVKHFAPPFHPGRIVYYHQTQPSSAIRSDRKEPDHYFFRWRKNRLVSNSGATFGVGTLQVLISLLLDFQRHEMEGDEEMLNSRIRGDWIIREGVPDEKILVGMEKILRSQLRIPAKLSVKELDREVFVAKGDFQLKPIGDSDRIEVFGKTLVSKGGGGGSGDLDNFLRGVSRFIRQRVVSGVTRPPEAQVQWHYNARFPHRKYAHEDRDVTGVLNHLTDQTGLTFTPGVRRVRVLEIERAE